MRPYSVYDRLAKIGQVFAPQIIHGDLKTDNVLVDEQGVPALADFGLSKMLEDHSMWMTSATSAPGTTRFKAPELLSGNEASVTATGDIYAFAMTCLVGDGFRPSCSVATLTAGPQEILSGHAPFPECRNDGAVVNAVLYQGKTPERPRNVQIPQDL